MSDNWSLNTRVQRESNGTDGARGGVGCGSRTEARHRRVRRHMFMSRILEARDPKM